MDQETARKLFAEGAALIVLDVPVGTEFGIDYNSWNVGEQFKGVKMIPPGVHFVYYSATGKRGGAGPGKPGPRTGFFFHAEKRQVLAKRWNPDTEELIDAASSEEELSRFRAGLQGLDRFLGPYPYDDGLRRWLSLTSHLTSDNVERLIPLNGNISSVSTYVTAAEEKVVEEISDAAITEGDQEEKPHEQNAEPERAPESLIRFCTIPKRLYPPNASAAEVTRCSLDKSYTLNHVLQTQLSNQPDTLLAELQFSFVCFLIGHVYDAFEHWKQVVALLCSCEDALVSRATLFHDFIGILHYQLLEAPTDFFVDIISTNNFLAALLQNLFAVVRESAAEKKLKDRTDQLQRMVTSRFNWNFDDDDEDDLPVVVEMN